MRQACVLIADISGSTRLFEERGNRDALGSIDYALSEHAGMSFGTFVEMDGDIFGMPVNTAARLAAKAKPGELLIDDLCHVEMGAEPKAQLQSIGALNLKGVDQPKEIFSYTTQGLSPKTQFVPTSQRGAVEVGVSVMSSGKTWRLEAGKSLVVGRAPDCGIVLGQAWVSRLHGTLSVTGGMVEFADHSSVGSLVQLESGEEVLLHRNKMLLTGEGVIYAGVTEEARATASVAFRVE